MVLIMWSVFWKISLSFWHEGVHVDTKHYPAQRSVEFVDQSLESHNPAISPSKNTSFPSHPVFLCHRQSSFLSPVKLTQATARRGQYVCSTSLGIRAAKLGSLLGPVSPQSSLAPRSPEGEVSRLGLPQIYAAIVCILPRLKTRENSLRYWYLVHGRSWNMLKSDVRQGRKCSL